MPETAQEWAAAAEVTFWVAHLNLPRESSLRDRAFALGPQIGELPVEPAAEIMYALSFLNDSGAVAAIAPIRERLMDRFQREMQIVRIEDDMDSIRIHFIVDLSVYQKRDDPSAARSATDVEEPLHRETMRRVETLRRLMPGRGNFGSQGYGHKTPRVKFLGDPTTKNIVGRKYLVPQWPVRLNATFSRLGDYRFRPDNWAAHVAEVLELRRRTSTALRDFATAVGEYFRRSSPTDIMAIVRNTWIAAHAATSREFLLPKDAVDEWGLISETGNLQAEVAAGVRDVALALVAHRPYRKAVSNITSALSNFFVQAWRVLPVLTALGRVRAPDDRARVWRAAESDGGTPEWVRLTGVNMCDAERHLRPFQAEFRARFAGFLPAGELDALERIERDTAHDAAVLWFTLSSTPGGRVTQFVGREANERVEAALERIRKAIRAKLKRLEGGVRAEMRSERQAPGRPGALWVFFDVVDATVIHSTCRQVYKILSEELPASLEPSLLRYAVDRAWPSVHIIPLVQGRSLDGLGWEISSLGMAVDSEDINPWKFMLRTVPEAALMRLGVHIWALPRLEVLGGVQGTTVELAMMLDHLAVVGTVPEPTGVGAEVLALYLERVGADAGRCVERLIARLRDVSQYLEALPVGALAGRPHLIRAARSLSALLPVMARATDDGARDGLGLDGLRALAEDLRAVLPLVDEARLQWATDVVANDQ